MSPGVTTVIAGIHDDLAFIHACYVANGLADVLPKFHCKKIYKSKEEWTQWLNETCKSHGWDHEDSHLIWRELGNSKNFVYVGSSSQFWKLIHDYYNVEATLSDEQLQQLQLDTLLEYKAAKELELEEKSNKPRRKITIYGAASSCCESLVKELMNTPELHLSEGLLIHLYDDSENFDKLLQVKLNLDELFSISASDSLSEGLEDCDVLIILKLGEKSNDESTVKWLRKVYDDTFLLAKAINENASSDLRIIHASNGASCFSAGVLAKICTKLNKHNIVAISSQFGLESLYVHTKVLKCDVREFGCPPVWGFLGINLFIDIDHTIQRAMIHKLHNRALKKHPERGSLPLGVKYPELRWFFYKTHKKNLKNQEIQYGSSKVEDTQRCKATIDLLKLWYAKVPGDEIISLGICSNGAFGIPEGVYFSQPSILREKDESLVWTPCSEFPMPIEPSWALQSLIDTAKVIVDEMINDSCECVDCQCL